MHAFSSVAQHLAFLGGVVGLAPLPARRRSAPRHIASSGLSAWIHVGLLGDRTTAQPIRGRVRVAPQHDQDVALEVDAAEGWPFLCLPTDRVGSARGWTGGRMFASIGEPVQAFKASWPERFDGPAWELQVVDETGLAVRCYAAPDASSESDLQRLHARLQAAALRPTR